MSHQTSFPKDLPDDLHALEDWLKQQEHSVTNVKAAAQASIIWADPDKKQRTEYVLVYLHGFKASHPEGDPIHRQVAAHFGWNLFLSRLEGHGLNVEKPLSDLQPGSLEASAEKALAIGKKLGEKVILMGTSTGGSLSLYLAGQNQSNNKIKALILYSPLIRFYSYNHLLLGSGIGRKLLKVISGRSYMLKSEPGISARENEIWYSSYAMQGALTLGEFVQKTMKPSLFDKVQTPTFTGFYYKNRREQDKGVSVEAIKYMYEHLATTAPQKTLRNYPKSGTHVISSGLLSKSINEIRNDTIQFLEAHTLT